MALNTETDDNFSGRTVSGEAANPAANSPRTAVERRPGDTSVLADRVRSLQLPREVTATGFRWTWLIWIVGLALIAAVAWFGYQQLVARAADSNLAAGGSGSAAGAAALDGSEADVILESKGYVIPVHEILVSPKISGMVLKLDIIEGQHVEQGKVLAVIESVDYKADLDHIGAILSGAKQRLLELEHGSRPEEVSEAKAEMDEASEQLAQLKSQFGRTKRLHETGAKVVTDTEFELAESTYYAMARRVDRLTNAHKLMVLGPRIEKIEAARADVAQAQADYDKTKWRFDNCVVRAAGFRHDPQEERRRGEYRQPDRVQRLLQHLHDGQLARSGSRPHDSRARHFQRICRPTLPRAYRGVPGSNLRRRRFATDADCRPREGRNSRPREIEYPAARRRPLLQAGNGRRGRVLQEEHRTCREAGHRRARRSTSDRRTWPRRRLLRNKQAPLPMPDEDIVRVFGVHKFFTRGSEQVDVLNDLTLAVPDGEFMALMGPSGSGKTTLLNLIAGLDRPSQGEVWVGDELISSMSESQLARWRTRHIGFIFQFYHLLSVFSAYENVELPLLLLPISAAARRRQVLTALELVGLSNRMHHRPGQLSGGQQQRVGHRAAIVTDPTLIVADEPTGDLDAKSAEEILNLLTELHATLRKTIILVTHDVRAGTTGASDSAFGERAIGGRRSDDGRPAIRRGAASPP